MLERERLAHEVGLQTSCIKARLHLAKALQGDKGSKWQLIPTTWAPALAILIAHSAADTPCMSPSGPMHMFAATGREVFRHSSIAHSISSMCSKYSQSKKSKPSETNTSICFLNSF